MTAGLAVILFLPLLTQGPMGTWNLLLEWKVALLGRGLPLETHNQSVVALLYRFLAGQPVHVVALGMHPVMLLSIQLSQSVLSALAMAWTALSLCFLVFWLFWSSRIAPLRWSVVLIAWLIVPSHLVWKPYFVMTLPVMVLALHDLLKTRRNYGRWALFVFSILIMNLTGFDFIGHSAAAYAEASSVFMITHLILIGLVVFPPQRPAAA